MKQHWFNQLDDTHHLKQAAEWERYESQIDGLKERIERFRRYQLLADLETIDRCVGRGTDGWALQKVLALFNKGKAKGGRIRVDSDDEGFVLRLGDDRIGSAKRMTTNDGVDKRPWYKLRDEESEVLLGMPTTKARAVGMLCRYMALKIQGIDPSVEHADPGWEP